MIIVFHPTRVLFWCAMFLLLAAFFARVAYMRHDPSFLIGTAIFGLPSAVGGLKLLRALATAF